MSKSARAAPVRRGSAERIEPEKELDPDQLKVYERMAAARLDLSRRMGVKAFLVFSNRELVELAREGGELTPKRLLALKGYGEERLAQYGEAFLQLLQNDETGGEPDGADSASGQPF